MKSEVVLSFFFILIPSLSGLQNTFPINLFSSLISANEEKVIGKLNEDRILPCSFKSGPEVVIHWKIQDSYVHSYYKDTDQLERQDTRYANRTSLFHRDIHNGNASLSLRRLNLQDEGIYICYAGTTSSLPVSQKVVLKVGAFHMPMMKLETSSMHSPLTCSMLEVAPRPNITWQEDNKIISENVVEEIGPLPPFHIKSTLITTFPNKSYECIIENSLLKETWTGRWTMKDHLRKEKSEDISLSCQLDNNFILPNQDFSVTWSRRKSGTSSVLAYFFSSSQNTIISESRFSWKKELVNQSDFSSTLTNLDPSDSGEYVCNISSRKYTLFMVHTLDVVSSQGIQRIDSRVIHVLILLLAVVMVFTVAFMAFMALKMPRHHLPLMRRCYKTSGLQIDRVQSHILVYLEKAHSKFQTDPFILSKSYCSMGS
ncbi:HERV-H LTR-associating protein 2 [Orycteropus afer afer]|uniref:HERV-H LTR-associating protein 2 n=1 Tax=Orycteropus afer afer TaxID=1230840 RepID=A0A8B7A9X6_ORYAF|nr:HERV-H LTR-associating protein 2 [Orycteropus afer afer]